MAMENVSSYTQLTPTTDASLLNATKKETQPTAIQKPTIKPTPADNFTRTTSTTQAPSNKPAEKPASLAPWMVTGASLLVSLGTLGIVATQFLKRPEEVPKALTEASLKPILERLTALEASVEKAGKGVELGDVETLINTLKKEVIANAKQQADGVQTKLLDRISQVEKNFRNETEIPILEIQRDVAEIKSTLKIPSTESVKSDAWSMTPLEANHWGSIQRKKEYAIPSDPWEEIPTIEQLEPLLDVVRPAVVTKLLKSAKLNPIDYVVPLPVSEKIQLLMNKYNVATGGVYLNGKEFKEPNLENPNLLDFYQPHNEANLGYADWVDTLKYAKEIHMGDEHGHIMKPVLTLFASGAARFKDDAKGEQFEQFTKLMETIMINPNCGLAHMAEWQGLLANLEVDANAPLVNFGHDALADRNFNDVYSIPFYTKLIELSKPAADAEPKFQFHLSNHGLSPLIDFLSTVVKGERLKNSSDDFSKYATFAQIDKKADPTQTQSYDITYKQLTADGADISQAMEHLVKPYLRLMKQASFITFNKDSNHLTAHAPLTTESNYIMEAYMGYTPNWNEPETVASELNKKFRSVIEKLETAIATDDYSPIDKSIYSTVDSYSRLTFTRANGEYGNRSKKTIETGELLTLPNNATVIHGHDTPGMEDMQALQTTASMAHHINLDNGFLHGFSRNVEKIKTEAQNSGVWDITKTHWLNNTTEEAYIPSLTQSVTEEAYPLPIAIY